MDMSIQLKTIAGKVLKGVLRVFERLDFRDYARFDFRDGEDGRPRLLDANINPTWYEGGKLSLMAGWAGHDYATMMRMILEAALTRAGISA